MKRLRQSGISADGTLIQRFKFLKEGCRAAADVQGLTGQHAQQNRKRGLKQQPENRLKSEASGIGAPLQADNAGANGEENNRRHQKLQKPDIEISEEINPEQPGVSFRGKQDADSCPQHQRKQDDKGPVDPVFQNPEQDKRKQDDVQGQKRHPANGQQYLHDKFFFLLIDLWSE